MKTIELKSVATIRTLSIDAIEKAKSGHPGMPMGAAPMAYALWTKFMNASPKIRIGLTGTVLCFPPDTDQCFYTACFILSGYDVSIEDLKNFRQWGSKTPGHPELDILPGVDATTGPLGQGIAMAVGMALAERHLAVNYNRDDLSRR